MIISRTHAKPFQKAAKRRPHSAVAVSRAQAIGNPWFGRDWGVRAQPISPTALNTYRASAQGLGQVKCRPAPTWRVGSLAPSKAVNMCYDGAS